MLDFGAVNRLPDGMPEPMGRLVRLALAGEAEAVLAGLREEGFVRPEVEVDAHAVLGYLRPMLAPIEEDRFRFSREWLRSEAARLSDPKSDAVTLGRQLNLPPEYLLIHRVTLGAIGVLCQLGAEGPFRAEVERLQPGFAEPGSEAAQAADAMNDRTGRPAPPESVPTAAQSAVVEPPPDDTITTPRAAGDERLG